MWNSVPTVRKKSLKPSGICAATGKFASGPGPNVERPNFLLSSNRWTWQPSTRGGRCLNPPCFLARRLRWGSAGQASNRAMATKDRPPLTSSVAVTSRMPRYAQATILSRTPSRPTPASSASPKTTSVVSARRECRSVLDRAARRPVGNDLTGVQSVQVCYAFFCVAIRPHASGTSAEGDLLLAVLDTARQPRIGSGRLHSQLWARQPLGRGHCSCSRTNTTGTDAGFGVASMLHRIDGNGWKCL